jgi:hypothetical protein
MLPGISLYCYWVFAPGMKNKVSAQSACLLGVLDPLLAVTVAVARVVYPADLISSLRFSLQLTLGFRRLIVFFCTCCNIYATSYDSYFADIPMHLFPLLYAGFHSLMSWALFMLGPGCAASSGPSRVLGPHCAPPS